MVEDQRRTFIIMYAEAIKTLQDELVSVLGVALARSFLFRFGFKSGHISAREMNLTAQGNDAIEYLEEIWMEMGFARPLSVKKKSDNLEIKLSETLESSFDGQGCDFTRGFLAGLMTAITNVSHFCDEKSCVSKGYEQCVFVIKEEVGG